MGSNTTQRRAQATVLTSKVGAFASWCMHVSCGPCGRASAVPMADLPPELTIMQALHRMRCRSCRGRIAAAAIDNQVPGWRARIVRVWGPGSYG